MLEKYEIPEALSNFIKILIPAMVGVGFKLAIEMKKTNTKVSILNVILSMVTGVGAAWILHAPVEDMLHPLYVSPAIALIAIVADKIGEFVIYKWRVDTFILAILNHMVNAFTPKDNQNK